MSGDWEQSFIETTDKDGKKEKKTRICEYCEVKLDNKQLEKFYELGKTWQKRDSDIVDKKLSWYKDTVSELHKMIQDENDLSMQLEKDHADVR